MRPLTRQRGGRPPIPRWFIFTEGTTEKEHIDGMNQRYTGHKVTIIPIDGGAAANDALLSELKRRLGRKGFDRRVDRAYIVLDQDERDDRQFEELRASIEGRGWYPALTKPCFEYWLLLHFKDERHTMTCDEATRSLREHWPEYRKTGMDHRVLDDKRDKAIERSKASLEQVVSTEGTLTPPIGRPFSMVHILVEDLTHGSS